MILKFDDSLLRPLAEDDFHMVRDWRNAEEIRSFMFTNHLIGVDEHRDWFESRLRDNPPTTLIYERDGIPRGVVSLSKFNRDQGICHWGFFLAPGDQPSGSGLRLGILALDYIFDHIGIRKLVGEVFSFNAASIRFHEKLGFKREGYFVQHVLKEGRFQDIVVFAAFRECWPELRKRLVARLAASAMEKRSCAA